jgi:hypothetical protein|tara:strand:+ start:8 stop:709 length:702 start_codon:yes stop_codon:yes gene_type:complete
MKDEILLDCYTFHPDVYNNFKPDFGAKFIPQWWKDQVPHLPPRAKGYEPSSTIKKCPAFVQYFIRGIVIPIWNDVSLHIMDDPKNPCEYHQDTQNGKKLEMFFDGSHKADQFSGFAKDDGFNCKLSSPWKFVCDDNISFTMTQPLWSQRETMSELQLLPAVISFYRQFATEYNYFATSERGKRIITLKENTPLAILHPMIDDHRKIKIKHHIIPFESWDSVHKDPKRPDPVRI